MLQYSEEEKEKYSEVVNSDESENFLKVNIPTRTYASHFKTKRKTVHEIESNKPVDINKPLPKREAALKVREKLDALKAEELEWNFYLKYNSKVKSKQECIALPTTSTQLNKNNKVTKVLPDSPKVIQEESFLSDYEQEIQKKIAMRKEFFFSLGFDSAIKAPRTNRVQLGKNLQKSQTKITTSSAKVKYPTRSSIRLMERKKKKRLQR